jgi:plastocyanin
MSTAPAKSTQVPTVTEVPASPEVTATSVLPVATIVPTASSPPPLPAPPIAPAPSGIAAPIRGYGYPYRLAVPAGSTVVWTNHDAVSHDVTATDDSWTSGLLGEGESWARSFGSAGTYAYICRAHPYMQAVLIVQ